MKVYNCLDDFPAPQGGSVLTIGNFDGVHLGHQAIIARAKQLACEHSLPLTGITFEPAPAMLLRPDHAPRILTSLQVKVELLEEQGLDQLVVIKPSTDFLSLDPAQFVERILVNRMAAHHVVEGQTFSFGNRRMGTMVSLDKLAQRFGFQTHLVEAYTIAFGEAAPVALSSTLVRQLVSTSQFARVRKCLGRDYVLAGHVVPGHQQGRRLGFPTANLQLYHSEQLVPENGVFAGYARLGNTFSQAWKQKRQYPAAISIGPCETFDRDDGWQIEAYLLDYKPDEPDLKEQHMILSLIENIRPQRRFESPSALAQAIENDCRTIRKNLEV